MAVKNENQSVLASEIKIIPAWAWALAGIVLVAAQLFFNIALAREAHPLAAWARPLLGLLAGVVGGCYLLLIGYICCDSKRRGMSSVLWTIVAIVIPNALGIILYFILRQPLRTTCPQCGHAIEPGFSFCPQCSSKLAPSCPQCRRTVAGNDVYCPYCGTSLRIQAVPVAAPPTGLPG